MIFEEFFLKKKIDLAQFEVAEPGLFAEFKSHYAQMSEKSFDHTKKYWFNKLRHQFPLSAEDEARLKEQFKGDKNTPASEALIETQPTEVAVAAKPAGFKPRFKAPASAPEEVAASKPTEEVKEETPVAKPTGFKPRFKAGATTTVPKTEKLPPKEITKEETPATTETPEVTAKPVGFKPRFKAGATKVVTEESKGKSIEELPPKHIEEPAADTQPEEAKPETTKPVGFKPRFKAGATKVVTEESKEELPPKHIEEPAADTQPEEAKPETTKPVGFKPRFKAGATKVINKDKEE